MKGRTKREKHLLYLLLIIIISTLGLKLLIQPTYNQLEQLKLECQSLKLEKTSVEDRISNTQEIESQYNEAFNFYQLHKDDYKEVNSNIEAEQYVLANLDRRSIKPQKTELIELESEEDSNKIISIYITAFGNREDFIYLADDVSNDNKLSLKDFKLTPQDEMDKAFFIEMTICYYIITNNASLEAFN